MRSSRWPETNREKLRLDTVKCAVSLEFAGSVSYGKQIYFDVDKATTYYFCCPVFSSTFFRLMPKRRMVLHAFRPPTTRSSLHKWRVSSSVTAILVRSLPDLQQIPWVPERSRQRLLTRLIRCTFFSAPRLL